MPISRGKHSARNNHGASHRALETQRHRLDPGSERSLRKGSQPAGWKSSLCFFLSNSICQGPKKMRKGERGESSVGWNKHPPYRDQKSILVLLFELTSGTWMRTKKRLKLEKNYFSIFLIDFMPRGGEEGTQVFILPCHPTKNQAVFESEFWERDRLTHRWY